MTATILDGRALAAALRSRLIAEAKSIAQERGRRASLQLVAVGDDPTAALYAEQVIESCRRIGLDCALRAFPNSTAETALRAELAAMGAQADVDGVVLLLPLPPHIRQRVVTEVLPPEKDVDGLGPRNAGHLMLGFPSYVPSTADAALELLRSAGLPLQGQDAVVVGRSNVGGKPAALLFLRENATVTICHSRTRGLAEITRQADILFASTGKPGSVTGAMVKPGAVVLDAGMNSRDGQLVGDVDFTSVREVAGYLTPVPGGLGPLTNLMLIRHTLLGPS
jgi:methylenetetrahydrofolate dehydrogenase (NADP+) / methenyltetrahydrofolate cyclohydrolase